MTDIRQANLNVTFEQDGNIIATMSAHTDDNKFECSAEGMDFDKVIFLLSNQLSQQVEDYLEGKKQIYFDINDMIARCAEDKNVRKYLINQISEWDEAKSMFGVSEKPAEKCGTKCDNSWKKAGKVAFPNDDFASIFFSA